MVQIRRTKTVINVPGLIFRRTAFRAAVYLSISASFVQGQIYNTQNGQVIPGSQGITLGPGIDLSNWDTPTHNLNYAELATPGILGSSLNLTGANFSNSWLEHADLSQTTMTDVNFSGADLSYASIDGSWGLAGANFTNAVVTGASLRDLSMAQVYSTANYQNKNLEGVAIGTQELAGWDFSNFDLSGANFSSDILTGANFTNAIIARANFGYALTSVVAPLSTTASYQQKDLHGIIFSHDDLTGWDLSGQNLTGASFYDANLTNVNFTNAIIANANFNIDSTQGAVSVTTTQLLSTASYKNGDMHGIWIPQTVSLAGVDLQNEDLDGAMLQCNLTNANLNGAALVGATIWGDLSGANLVHANLNGARLATSFSGADLTNATISGVIMDESVPWPFTNDQVYSTQSYKNRDLHGVYDLYGGTFAGVDLTGFDLSSSTYIEMDFTGDSFAGANLTGAYFALCNFTGADFTNAVIVGANIGDSSTFTEADLYSTASYKEYDLHGLILQEDFANLNLSHQDLIGASIFDSDIGSANFTSADLRGATLYPSQYQSQSTLRNTILPDGTIQGLALLTGDQLTIHNYTIPISVLTSMTLAHGSTLQMDFDSSPWTSTITTPTGVTPQLAGILSLTFIPGVDPTTLIGTSYQLFDWAQSPTGAFDQIDDGLPAGLYWDLSDLYTTGTVTLLPEPTGCSTILLLAAGLGVRRYRR